jgi:thiamine-monophosphate kinase
VTDNSGVLQKTVNLLQKAKMVSEADIIRLFTRSDPNVVLGPGDDSALFRPEAGMEMAVSTDMLVSGQHFFTDTDPYKLGHKSLAVNLSDMAAMGANPRWATLALALPESLIKIDTKWVESFARGLLELACSHRVALIGGDVTRGPLTICIQIIGEVAKGRALRRSGARVGDDIWISGKLGDAALALLHERHQIKLEPDEFAECLNSLLLPVARVDLGQRLVGLANSAIDISDGLLADLGHILERSNVAATISLEEVNCSVILKKYFSQPQVINCMLAGGDDYELCFTVPKERRSKIDKISQETGIPLTRIGKIIMGEGLVVLDSTEKPIMLETTGYDHFHTT